MKPEEQKAQRCVLWLQSVEERARSWQNANPAAAANLRDLAYDRSLFFYERVKWAQVSKRTCTAFICARLRAMNNAGHSEQVEDELEYLCGSLNVSIKDKAVQAAWCEAKEAMSIHCDIYDDLQVSEPQL